MGHDVNYAGKLTVKNKLTSVELELFEYMKNDCRYDYFYALDYEDSAFEVNNSHEKIYPDKFFKVIEEYVKRLKEGGNDIVEGSRLISCSEYGFDEESIIFSYQGGKFVYKKVEDLVEEYCNN